MAALALALAAVHWAGEAHARAFEGPPRAILRVTTLADAGEGSFRAAVEAAEPRYIVFDVAGEIALESDIVIRAPHLWIAGQTAPGAVAVTGASVRIRASDVLIQHMAFRPGRGPPGKPAGNRDALSIGGGAADRSPTRDVRIEHVSTAWGTDETIGLWAPAANIVVQRSIVAESLRRAGHPKGEHSMGLLVGETIQGVVIRETLFSDNVFRNPVIGAGAGALVLDNAIYNPMQNAAHLYDRGADSPTNAAFVGNVLVYGPDTRPGRGVVTIPSSMRTRLGQSRLYFAENCILEGPCGLEAINNAGDMPLADASPTPLPQRRTMSAEERWRDVLAGAGARPAARDAVDQRIVAEAAGRTGALVDAPPPAPPMLVRAEPAAVPEPAFVRDPATGRPAIEAWLCARHRAVGGRPTETCPEG